MATSTINLPGNLTSGIIEQSSGLFGSFSPVVTMIIGLVAFFFVARVLIGIMQRRREEAEIRRELELTAFQKAMSNLGFNKTEAKNLERKIGRDKATKKAILLRGKFEEVMAGKDRVSVDTI